MCFDVMLNRSTDIGRIINSIIVNLLKNDMSYLSRRLAKGCRLVKQHNVTFISESLNLYYLITQKTKCSDN